MHEGSRSTVITAALDAIVGAGYDRDYDEILSGARGALRPPRPCGRWREIEVRRGSVRLPRDVGLDLGGVAKGWTVDLAVEEAIHGSVSWALVTPEATCGSPETLQASTWRSRTRSWPRKRRRDCASGPAPWHQTRHAWGPGLHHVIDPRTGAPSTEPVLQATAWAPTCAEAEVLATWALLTGPRALETVPGAVATSDGTLFMNLETIGQVAA